MTPTKKSRRKELRNADGNRVCQYCGKEIFMRRVFCSSICASRQGLIDSILREPFKIIP